MKMLLITTCTETNLYMHKFKFNGYFQNNKIKKIIAKDSNNEFNIEKNKEYILSFEDHSIKDYILFINILEIKTIDEMR